MKKSLCLATLTLLFTLPVMAQTLIPFRNEKGLWGFKNQAGQIVVTPEYNYRPEPFSEGRAVVMKIYNQRGVIDETGQLIVPFQYYNISSFKNGFAVASKEYLDTVNKINGKPQRGYLKGILDRNGKEIVPVRFKNLTGDFSNGWFVIADTGGTKKFYINTSGELVYPPAGITLLPDAIDGKLFVAHKSYKYGLVDKNFKEILPFEYRQIRPAAVPGLLIVRKENAVGLMDLKLKWLIEPKFNSISNFKNGFASFTDTSKLTGVINTAGKITTPAKFESISMIEKTNSTLAVFKNPRNDNSGLLDMATGKIIIPNNFQFSSSSYEYGLISYRKDNKKMLMDSTGRQIFAGEYEDFVTGSKEAINWIRKDGKYGFMTQTGKVIVEAKYESVLGFSEGFAAVKLDGLFGYIDRSGKLVIPLQYVEAGSFEGGVARVKDKAGNILFISPPRP
ncbi:MAG: WG repeat-containing protein [Chitinophagaceae bacterium]